MAILARTMRFIGYDSQVQQKQAAISSYKDYESISAWAVADVELNLKAQTIQGNQQKELHPKDDISRAESITAIIWLLQTASLIE